MNLINICAVIDIDGFHTSTTFYPREFGYTSLTKRTNESFRFKLNHLAKQLSSKDWKTVRYCTRHIHGLRFCTHPQEKDLHDAETLKQLIQCMYNDNKTLEKYIIAYKGGCVEKQILDELEIPSVNLEDFECPKYEHLPKPSIKDCGYHSKYAYNNAYVHCPKVECYAFADWIMSNIM